MISEQKINEIEKIYNSFFKECDEINRCEQNTELKNKCKECNLYDHGLILSKNYFDTEKKVLVVGIEKRGPKTAQSSIEIRDVLDPARDNRNLHWLATVLAIIKFYHPEFTNNKMDEIEKNDDEREQLCKECSFSFTDFYKCGFSVEGKFSKDMIHTNSMKEGCLKIFNKEIEYLIPNLIIVQGKSNVSVSDIDKFFSEFSKEDKYKNESENIVLCCYKKDNKIMNVIFMPFPQRGWGKWEIIKYDLYKAIEKVCNQ